jgi:hypothetical protein
MVEATPSTAAPGTALSGEDCLERDLKLRLEAIEACLAKAECRAAGAGSPNVIAARGLSWKSDGSGSGTVFVGPDGGTGVMLTARSGQPRVAFGVGPNGCPNLWMMDGQPEKRLDVYLATNDCPQLSLVDGDGATRMELVVDPRGAPSLAVLSDDSRPIGGILVRADGEPLVHFADEGEET